MLCRKRKATAYFDREQVCNRCFNKLRNKERKIGNPTFIDKLYNKYKKVD